MKFGDSYALKGVTFALPEKGMVALLGKSGSGKSTILNLIAGFLKPSKGSIRIDGISLGAMDDSQRADYRLSKIGFIYQHYNLLNGVSALENVMLPGLMKGKEKKAKEKARALLNRFGLSAKQNTKIDVLSGGEKQRVAICRALMNDPSLLLCDEPTGALDEKNAKATMEILKEVAKERLVLMVSHNQALVDEYCDRQIHIQEGRVDETFKKKKNVGYLKKSARSSRWSRRFTIRNLKKNYVLDGVGFLASSVGLLALLLGVGFSYGSSSALEERSLQALDVFSFTIREKTYIENENSPLKLVRSNRPTRETIVDLFGDKGYSIENDYSYFVPSHHTFRLNEEEQDGVSFDSVYSFALGEAMPHEGKMREEDSLLYANQAFMDAFPKARVGDEIRFEIPYLIHYKGATDQGLLPFSYTIAGVMDEFAFLNSPRLYYRYPGLAGTMATVKLPNISVLLGEEATIDSFIEMLPGDNPATGYDYLLFPDSLADAKRIQSKKLEERFAVENACFARREAFGNLTQAFTMSLMAFLAIAAAGVAFIIGMSAFSVFMRQRKENATLLSLGARGGDIQLIYLRENLVISLIGAVFALVLSYPASQLVNQYLGKRFGLHGLISIPIVRFYGVPFLLPILVLAAAGLLSTLATFIPLHFMKNAPVAEVLRDE